jgi:LytS/YehU family sensor histidine kinase
MDKAIEFLSDFSKVVRQIFKHASFHSVPLNQEIDFITAFLRLEKMRFPELFDFHIQIRGDLSIDNLSIPPMMVQPFVENAIRHAFKGIDRKGLITITFENSGPSLLKVTIEDNGIGREQTIRNISARYDDTRPHSTQITENRIQLLNTPDVPDQCRIVYTDLFQDGQPAGLRVEIYLPV